MSFLILRPVNILLTFNRMYQSKANTLKLLEMFAPECARYFQPGSLDHPRNGITMRADIHSLFGKLRLYLEPVEGVDHTYIAKVTSRFDARMLPPSTEPVSFADCPDDVEPPSPWLLAIHRSLTLVAHASGAAEYIDHVLRDRDDGFIRADGTTHLSTLIAIGVSTSGGLVPVH